MQNTVFMHGLSNKTESESSDGGKTLWTANNHSLTTHFTENQKAGWNRAKIKPKKSKQASFHLYTHSNKIEIN